jgi:hypothetical protein
MTTDDPLAQLVLAFIKLAALLPLLAGYIIVVAVARIGSWLVRRSRQVAERAERDLELRRVLRETEAASRRISRIMAAGEREIRGHVRRAKRRNNRW